MADHAKPVSKLQAIIDMSDTESVIEFPCSFPIKAVGKSHPELDATVVEIILRHASEIAEGAVHSRPSKGGKYTSVTVTIEATSRAQLDAIYMDLSQHPMIIMSL